MKKQHKKNTKKQILAYLKKNYSGLKVRKDVVVYLDDNNSITSDIYIPSKDIFLFISKDESDADKISRKNCTTLIFTPNECRKDWKRVKKEIKSCIANHEEATHNVVETEAIESEELIEENIHGGFIHSEQNVQTEYAEKINELERQERGGTEISELIGNPPGWLLRSGITIVAFVVGVIIFFSSVIKYPDKITCQAELTSSNPPTPILANVEGYISDVLIENNSDVEKGDKIFYIRNTANAEHVVLFNEYVQSLESGDLIYKINALKEPQKLKLGAALQPTYSQIVLKVKEYKQVLGQNRTEAQLKTINREIEKLNQLNQNSSEESDIYDKELELVQKEFERQKELYDDGVVSQVDLENAEAVLNKYRRDEISIKQGNVRNDIRIEELKLQKETLLEQRSEKVNQFQFELLELMTSWKTQFLEWQETYYIIAESSGKLECISSYNVNSPLSKSALIGYIIPADDNDNKKFIRAYAPSTGSGKIKEGSKAIVKLDAYPYKEYGLIISEVANISTLTNIESQNKYFYELIIPLEDTIKTDHQFEVPYSPNMTGTAEVITDDRSILFRIMSEFLSLVKE